MQKRRKGRDKAARIATVLAAGFLLGTYAPPDRRPRPPLPPVVAMQADPVPLDEPDPERRRLGALLFLEGWHLWSRDVRLGGISAMHVEGGEVLALSDAGSLFRFPLPRRAGRLPLRIARVEQGPGSGRGKGDRDGESMAVAEGTAWVAWEGANEIWRYRLSDWRRLSSAAPKAMDKWRSMRGPEAMVRLPDGRFLVFAEGGEAADGPAQALLFPSDPSLPGARAVPLRYRAPRGFRATDAALLPDGRLLILNRRFRLLSSFSAILSVAALPRRLAPGAVIEPRELASFRDSVTRDNYEALSVTREGARTIVWIMSDDNYTPILQRTLLLKFALEPIRE